MRAASALVLGPVALSCIWFGGWAFRLLIVLVTVGLVVEWVLLWRRKQPAASVAPVAAAILLAVVLATFGAFSLAFAIVVAGSLVACLSALWRPAGATVIPPGVVAGIPYIALGTLAVLWVRDDPVAGRANLLFMLLLIWASDIGAYLAGRLIGGAKMAPLISPGKTWSGAAGGLLCAVAAGWVAALLLQPPVAPGRLVPLALALGVVAQAGDLLESWIKRWFGVKDSGWLIPGHGGLFDRLDAVLAAAPVAAALALSAGRGVVLWQ